MIPDRVIRRIGAAAACAAAWIATQPAHAFRTASDLPELASDVPVTWPTAGLVLFERARELPDTLDDERFEGAFTDGAAFWSEINCDGPAMLLTSQQHEGPTADDRINSIAFVASDELPGGVPDETPAVTELQYERDGDGVWRIVEADIYLNADREWLAGDASTSLDLVTVLAHELGHVVGLLHPCEPDGAGGAPECEVLHEAALMFPLYYEAGTALSDDDEHGYCYLYPEPKCLPGSRGCAPQDELDECVLTGCGDSGTGDASIVGIDKASRDDAGVAAAACEQADAGSTEDSCAAPLEFASECSTGADCASGLCIGAAGSVATCTRMCGGEDGACPNGFECESVGGRPVCLSEADDGGCSVTVPRSLSQRRSPNAQLFSLILIVVAFIRLRFARSNSLQMPS